MPTLIEFLRNNSLEALSLSADFVQRLKNAGIVSLIDLFSSLQMHKFGKSPGLKGWDQKDIDVLNHALNEFFAEKGVGKTQKARETVSVSTSRLSESVPKSAMQSQIVIDKSYFHILGGDLLEHEAIVRSKIRNIDLIGELTISKNNLDTLAVFFRRIFGKHSTTTALDAIENGAPISFALFLVAQGVYGYAGGDYWTSVNNALEQSNHQHFGQVFERIIRKNHLPVFEELQKKSAKYVSLILAHGGIPLYSLDDYFSNLVLPSIIRPQYSDLNGQELIDALLSSSAVVTTDKPVTHFLEFGGRVALDVFNRSRQMLIQWQNSQTIPESEEIGLPNHMVDHFQNWVEKQGNTVSAQKTSRNRLKKPEFCLDPWGTGIFLRLPSQSVSIFDSNNCEWHIQSGENFQKIAVAQNALGVTQEITLRLDVISNSYWVKFVQDKKEYEWLFKMPGSIFIFNPDTGTLQTRITNAETWLVYPKYLEIGIRDGDGFQTEELPSLPGTWYNMRAEGWDFTLSRKIVFASENSEQEFEILHQEVFRHPVLSGGNLLKTNLDEKITDGMVYIGRPPEIQIPIVENAYAEDILSRWRITIRPVGYADPEDARSTQLNDLSSTAFLITPENISIQLAHKKLLGSRPIGTFEIAMVGPLGQDINFTVTCLPECEFEGLDQLNIPSRMGALEVPLKLHLGIMDLLQSPDEMSGVKIQNSRPGIYTLLVPKHKSRVKLQIVREYHEDEIIVPIEIRVLRLRWRLVTQDILPNWSDELLNVPVPFFLQQTSPLLIVSLPGMKKSVPTLWLRMLDINLNEMMKIFPASRSKNHVGDFWRFDLNVLKTTLNESATPIVRLELVAENDSRESIFELPVVSFTRAINMHDIKATVSEEENQKILRLTWKERTTLENRTLFFWPLWRPWETPRMIRIPDDAKQCLDIVLSESSWEGGEYRLSFAVVDPWVNSKPSIVPPQAGGEGTYDFNLMSNNRISLLMESAQSFSDRLELAIISANQVGLGTVAPEIHWCIKNIRFASAQQVLVLKDHLEDTDQQALLKELGENIISPGVLAGLIESVENENMEPKQVGALLKYAPPSSSWTDSACELLFDFDDQYWRIEALRGLVMKKPQKAVKGALSLIKNGAIAIEDAVELLYENGPKVVEQIQSGYPKNQIAKKILGLLEIYNPSSGLPMVRPGTWFRTDAGWGKIENIQDAVSRLSVDEFIENEGVFKLSVMMHIELDPTFQGERATIDMKEKTISFPRAKQCYVCDHCQGFITAGRELYRSHIAIEHPGKYPSPPNGKTSFPYTFLEFDHSRK